jgi:hypothetical protein
VSVHTFSLQLVKVADVLADSALVGKFVPVHGIIFQGLKYDLPYEVVLLPKAGPFDGELPTWAELPDRAGAIRMADPEPISRRILDLTGGACGAFVIMYDCVAVGRVDVQSVAGAPDERVLTDVQFLVLSNGPTPSIGAAQRVHLVTIAPEKEFRLIDDDRGIWIDW